MGNDRETQKLPISFECVGKRMQYRDLNKEFASDLKVAFEVAMSEREKDVVERMLGRGAVKAKLAPSGMRMLFEALNAEGRTASKAG